MTVHDRILALEAALCACEGLQEFAQERKQLEHVVGAWTYANYPNFGELLAAEKKAVTNLARYHQVFGG